MKYTISAPYTLSGQIRLPASKSISNRALILNALSLNENPVENLSDCDDTKVMINAFTTGDTVINIGAAGTSMRFLTAFLAQAKGVWILTGTKRMKNRPIGSLVEALRNLGAQIKYIEKDGFPPLKIHGNKLRGGEIELDGSISSQYISALMMIGPSTEKGLIIDLKGAVISKPYIRLTKQMMEDFGVKTEEKGNRIIIPAAKYKPVKYKVESDWSAASYWYEMLSLSGNDNDWIELTGLYKNSLQGDSKVAELFHFLGVSTEFNDKGVLLRKTNIHSSRFNYDFTNEPDLAQTFVVTCCLKNIPFRFTGLQSLKIKETDRIFALKTELNKLGYLISDRENSILEWNGETTEISAETAINTYEDHRMAMAFAPVALVKKHITINDPQVITKSYPGFWKDLETVGFTIESEIE